VTASKIRGNIGVAETMAGNYQHAFDILTDLLDNHWNELTINDQIEFLATRANCQRHLGHPDRALQDATQAVNHAADPNVCRAAALEELARIHLTLNHPDQARDALREAAHILEPHQPDRAQTLHAEADAVTTSPTHHWLVPPLIGESP
jgi:hypothetical protein